MMNLYKSYITDRKGTIQRRLFESVDEYMNDVFEEDTTEEKLEIIDKQEDEGEVEIEGDDLDALLEDIDDEKDELDDLLDEDEDSDDDINFDQLGGMEDSDGYYETKVETKKIKGI